MVQRALAPLVNRLMKFDLVRPCESCPFSTNPGAVRYLGYDRAEQIVESVLNDETFTCHKTNDFSSGDVVETSDSQHCAGVLILLEREEMPNQMMRWMGRLGVYDYKNLDMDSPVVDDFESFIGIQGK